MIAENISYPLPDGMGLEDKKTHALQMYESVYKQYLDVLKSANKFVVENKNDSDDDDIDPYGNGETMHSDYGNKAYLLYSNILDKHKVKNTIKPIAIKSQFIKQTSKRNLQR